MTGVLKIEFVLMNKLIYRMKLNLPILQKSEAIVSINFIFDLFQKLNMILIIKIYSTFKSRVEVMRNLSYSISKKYSWVNICHLSIH